MELKTDLKSVNEWFTTARVKSIFITYSIILLLLAVLPINSSSSPINNTYIISIRLDYILHFLIYLPWMFLLQKMVRVSFRSNIYLSFLCIFLGFVFAFFTEAIQYILPYRAFNINDMMANGLGVLLGSVVFFNQTLTNKTI